MIRFLVEIDTGEEIIRASSACRDPLNPSDIRYSDSLGNRYAYPVRLAVPSINQKIADAIAGAYVFNQYNISLDNNDGLYDDLDQRKIWSANVTLYRSDKEQATLDDFDVVSTGTVDYPIISKTKAILYVNTKNRSLTEEICRIFTTDDYPNLPDTMVDKKIPIAYGEIRGVSLQKVDSTDDTKYIAIDPNYLISVDTVYDSDGNSISFTGPDVDGIITATDAATADIHGLGNNRIGEMIVYEMEQKSGITYDATNWDLSEAGNYVNTSAHLNYFASSGTVKTFIKNVLTSDNAFLFTKNNGKLTIRRWGVVYNIWNIPEWSLMQYDKRDFKDSATYFNSSALVYFDKNQGTGEYENQYIDATQEAAIELAYGRTERKSYNTDLYLLAEAEDLASRLVDRFGTMSPNIRVGIGESTANINLLDILKFPVKIGRGYGQRTMTTEEYWVVRECNPGQDQLYLEALSGYSEPDMIDGVLAMPLNEEVGSGVLSEPISEERDGGLSQPGSVLT